MSTAVTVASLTLTVDPDTVIVDGAALHGRGAGQRRDLRRAHLARQPRDTSALACSIALFSGLSSSSTVPAGSLANAASVGAKTVNGPGDFKVAVRSAAVTAATSVPKSPAACAVATMSTGGPHRRRCRCCRCRTPHRRRP